MDNTVHWKGNLPAPIGGNSYRIEPTSSGAMICLYHSGLYLHLYVDSLPHLFNLYRDLGSLLDTLQPGLINPLPDGSPDELDAMKVIFQADQVKKGIL